MISWQRIVFRHFVFLFLFLFLFLFILPVSLVTATAGTGQAEDTFELANQAYSKGDFPAAEQNYLKTATERGVSASLLYNLANTYAEMGQTGKAILSYEQALRLDHNNGDIRSNLAVVRKQNGLYSEGRPLRQQYTDLLGANQWMMLCGVFFFIFSGCLLTRSLADVLSGLSQKESIIRTARYSAGIALFAALVTLPATMYSYQSWNDGVVLTDSRLLISPFTAAASAGTIREGRVIRPLKDHNDFVLVMDTSGQKGWLDRKQLGFIRDLPGKKTEK